MSILVLREGLFHKIKASKKQDLYALEVETPYIKKNLIRLQDNYGRKNKVYENLNSTKKLSEHNLLFKNPKNKKFNLYNLNDVNISISYYKNFEKFKNFDDKSVSIILDGKIVTKNGDTVIGVGEIVKSMTLKKLSNNYFIKRKMLVLRAYQN